ncbi:MAG: hypothetical protein ACK55Z_30240, partial [bacterium]
MDCCESLQHLYKFEQQTPDHVVFQDCRHFCKHFQLVPAHVRHERFVMLQCKTYNVLVWYLKSPH